MQDIFCNQISDKIELFVSFILQSCDRYSIWSSGGEREKFNQTKHLLIYSACGSTVLVLVLVNAIVSDSYF